MNLETVQKFFAKAQDNNPGQMPGLGGLQRLQKLADGEVSWDIEFVSMACKIPADPVIKDDGPLFPGLFSK
ncbi:uncharacterized protein K444DRAFT_615887 [Hyaloscypha bicolor E]|uniref:Uncharacterized protein n=1 Tax=Hyaloscypha bicolor E TaxID=1095630 RepID=A0A2J6T349_9HELO|nr:uncharacterized protein K444DRAFT_615887 [Hyaloscypha bicolor E]PMD57436.1 hypothetical protein K444DRAFT_615887 [Hyaloscypha bicolor E]